MSLSRSSREGLHSGLRWECIFQNSSQLGDPRSIILLKQSFYRLEILQEVKALAKKSTPETMAMLTEKRAKLQLSIDDFHRKAAVYVPETDLLSGSVIDEESATSEWEDAVYDSEDDDILLPMPGTFIPDVGAQRSASDEATTALPAEKQLIRLPSSFGREACHGRLRPYGRVEFDVRKGQANDALHTIRLHIAEKSFIYRGGVRKGSNTANLGHRGRQKAFNEAHILEAKVRHQARIYEGARKAMETLGMSEEDIQNYPKLSKSDTNASTAVVDFNARGQRNEGLSWIWRTPHEMTRDSRLMNECMFFLYLEVYLC